MSQFFTQNISTPTWQLDQWTKYLPLNLQSVLDMTGNVGTEGIYMTKFRNITKVQINEIDKETFKKLEQNISSLPSFRKDKITVKNIDSTKDLDTPYDLILCDAPWGGQDYKQDNEEAFTTFRQKIYNNERATNPLKPIELKLGEYTILQLTQKMHYKVMALKLPLNDVLSPYCSKFKPIDDALYIPIKNDKQKQIKYIIILVVPKVEQNFLDRQPKIDFTHDQIRHITDKKLLQAYIKHIYGIEAPDLNQSDKQIIKYLKTHGKPQLDTNIRASKRAESICKLYKFATDLDICDIGCDDGRISYDVYKTLKAKSLTMFDPYGKYFQKETKDVIFNREEFRICPDAFDIIMLITCLHHITNPEWLVNQIRLSLKPHGYVIVREHVVSNDQDKLLLSTQEKLYEGGFSNSDVTKYPSASYFTKDQLLQLFAPYFRLLKTQRDKNLTFYLFINDTEV